MGVLEADLVLLTELSLQGQLIEIPEVLYWQRRHAGSAIPSAASEEALLAWHDPERAKERILLPHWVRTYLEYFKGVQHAHLSVGNRILCSAAVPSVGLSQAFLRWTGPFRQRHGLYRKSASKVHGTQNQAEASR